MNWGPLIYQYVLGGAIFFGGFWIAFRSGDYSLRNREDRLTALCLLAIFLLYLGGHILWQILALAGPGGPASGGGA